jgi:hypothetical protein
MASYLKAQYLASVTILTLTQNGIATSDNRLHLVESPSGALPDLAYMKTADAIIRNLVHRLHSCVKIRFGEAAKPNTNPCPRCVNLDVEHQQARFELNIFGYTFYVKESQRYELIRAIRRNHGSGFCKARC